jgi:DNA-binding transcriptional MerR regulator
VRSQVDAPAPSDDSFRLTVGSTSRRLNKSERTIRIWADRGRLASIRASNGVRLFRVADVEALARQLGL